VLNNNNIKHTWLHWLVGNPLRAISWTKLFVSRHGGSVLFDDKLTHFTIRNIFFLQIALNDLSLSFSCLAAKLPRSGHIQYLGNKVQDCGTLHILAN